MFTLGAVAAAIVAALLASQRLDQRPRTDDAYLDADVVHMAPDVSGRVVALKVTNNQPVRAGDLLLVIDPEPFRLQLEQARAQLAGLQATLANTTNQVASQTSKADAANTGIGSAQAQLALASSTLARLEPLLPRGYVTAEQVDQARTSQRTAQIALQQARQQAQEARQGVSSTKPTEEQIAAAGASVAIAERNLRLTEVRSPCDGVITGLNTVAGEYGEAGHPLFTIIDTERWYAVGNFRETELARLQPGQHARVYVMTDPKRAGRRRGGKHRERRVAGRRRVTGGPATDAAQPELGAHRAALPGPVGLAGAADRAGAAGRLRRHRDRPVSAAAGAQPPLVDEGRLSGFERPCCTSCGRGPAGWRTRCGWWRSSCSPSRWRRSSASRNRASAPTSSCSSPAGSAPPPSRRPWSAGLAVVLAVFATIAVFMASLSEPALRVPLIALVTFVAMALSRASKLGPAAFAAGFIIAYGLTIGDQVLGVSLQSSAVGNTTDRGLPDLLFLPPEEALLHSLLWLTVVVAMPVGLVVAGNLLTGRQPVELLRDALAARLATCARFCAGDVQAGAALAASARDGRAAMEPLLEAAGHTPGQPDYGLLIRESEQIAVGLLTWRLIPGPADRTSLQPLAAPLRAAADCVRDGVAQAIVIPEPPDATDAASRPIARRSRAPWRQ